MRTGLSRVGVFSAVLDVLGHDLPALCGPDRDARLRLIADVHEIAREEQARRLLVFAQAARGLWLVGPPEDLRLVPGASFGIRAAWLAIGGARPLCAELRPGSAHAASLVCRAVHETAARWAEIRAGSRELASACRRVHVSGGRLCWDDQGVDIRTEHVNSMSTDLHIGGRGAHDSRIVHHR